MSKHETYDMKKIRDEDPMLYQQILAQGTPEGQMLQNQGVEPNPFQPRTLYTEDGTNNLPRASTQNLAEIIEEDKRSG